MSDSIQKTNLYGLVSKGTFTGSYNPANNNGIFQPIKMASDGRLITTSSFTLPDGTGWALYGNSLGDLYDSGADIYTDTYAPYSNSFMLAVDDDSSLVGPVSSRFVSSADTFTNSTSAAGMVSAAVQYAYDSINSVFTPAKLHETEELTLLSSAPRATTTNTTDQNNFNKRGLHLYLAITNVPGGGETLTLTLQGKTAGGVYYDLLISSLITATGTYIFKLYPSLTPVAAQVANDALPKTWRVSMVHSSTGSWTYTLDANMLI